jgi:hypothetical protein
VDENFWQAIQDIAAKAAQGVGIANFVVEGGSMTVVMTDHTLMGPYPLPITKISFRGPWLPHVPYLTNDIITHGGATYHTGLRQRGRWSVAELSALKKCDAFYKCVFKRDWRRYTPDAKPKGSIPKHCYEKR